MRFGPRKYHEQKDILLVELRPKVLGLEFERAGWPTRAKKRLVGNISR